MQMRTARDLGRSCACLFGSGREEVREREVDEYTVQVYSESPATNRSITQWFTDTTVSEVVLRRTSSVTR